MGKADGRGVKRGVSKTHKKTYRTYEYIHYSDCSDGFKGVKTLNCTLYVCALWQLYLSKPEKKKKTVWGGIYICQFGAMYIMW